VKKCSNVPANQLLSLYSLTTIHRNFSYADGSLVPFYKSEEIPEPNDGPVRVIVGKNFEDVVLDQSKAVFLKVYAPWCG
jgi:protein disulfide-isomerase A1